MPTDMSETFRKVGKLIEQGMAILPKLRGDSRLSWEGTLYDHLGTERMPTQTVRSSR